MKRAIQKTIFHVVSRKDKKKPSSQSKMILGNIYGLHKPSISVVFDGTSFHKLYREISETAVLYLAVDGSAKHEPVLIETVQKKSVGKDIQHVAFRRVDLKEKIETDVPVVITGETKIDQSVITLVKDFVTVSALPTDFPEEFEVDISGLKEIGESITLADLKYNSKAVEIILHEGEELDTVALVVVQALEEEKAEDEAEVTDVSDVGTSGKAESSEEKAE